MDQARYVELFRTESREHLAELDAALLAYEQRADTAHVATLFRSTHTIKGMAAAMGYIAVERLAHALESLLDALRTGRIATSPAITALLFDGTDMLRGAIDIALSGRADAAPHVTASDVNATVQRLTVAASGQSSSTPNAAPRDASRVTQPSLRAVDGAAPSAGNEADARLVRVRLSPDSPLKGVRALMVLTRLQSLASVSSLTPPQATWQSDDFDGVFTATCATSESADAIESALRAVGDVAAVTVSAVAAPTRATRQAAMESMRTVRVDRRRLDTLLDLVGELVVTRERLLKLADEHDQSSTRSLVRTAHETARLIGALQDEVLQARMVPVGQVFDRFPRLVRDVARDLGKDVEFVMEGREIELDRALLDAMADPLLHLLRNALDHGLEDADTRTALGKPATGRLVLRAVRDRASVVIQVEDDGRGIDRRVILRRAREQGLLTQDETDIDDDSLLHLLAQAGFSTARTVTSISGRGVGVDVVATRVRALGGALELETLQGEGTVFTVRLPLTVAITRALLVNVAGDTYALPAAHVVEALEFNPDSVVPLPASTITRDNANAVTLRDELVPIVPLRERFGHERYDGDSYLAVVEVAGRRSALLVDALVAQQDIVVKQIDVARGSAPWFSGATVLGDGTPALIVDLGSLT